MRSAALGVVVVLFACGGGGGSSAETGDDDDGTSTPASEGSSDDSATATAADADTSGGAETGDPDPDPEFTPEEWAALQELSPDPLPGPPLDPSNAYADDAAAAALGQVFFFTPLFSGQLLDGDQNGMGTSLGNKGETGKVSCASCHVPADAFTDTRSPSQQISLGSGWGRRRAPSLLDVGQSKVLMWDGRHDTMYNQVFGPIESPVEMNSSRLFVAHQVFALFRSDYEAVFGPMPPLDDADRFPPLAAADTGCIPGGQDPQLVCDGTWRGYPGDQAEYDSMTPEDQEAVTRVVVNVGKAIGAYERLLTCGPTRFDAWIHGDDEALSRAEQRGAQIFVGPGGCVSCHSGPFMSDQQFHNVGLAPAIVASAFIDADDPGAQAGLALTLADPLNVQGIFSDGDDGRLPRSVTPQMEGAFRTPMLRCVNRRPSFFHTGQALGLLPVVQFFDMGGDLGGFLGQSEIAPLGLTSLQREDLVAFLRALDGPGPEDGLLGPPP